MAHEQYDPKKKGTITEQTAAAQKKRYEEELKEQRKQQKKEQGKKQDKEQDEE